LKIELRRSQDKIRTVEASFFRTIENNNRTIIVRKPIHLTLSHPQKRKGIIQNQD